MNEINELTLKNKFLKRKKLYDTNWSRFTWRKTSTDAKMNFYTGIFSLIKLYFPTTLYWTAPAKNRVTSKNQKIHSVAEWFK